MRLARCFAAAPATTAARRRFNSWRVSSLRAALTMSFAAALLLCGLLVALTVFQLTASSPDCPGPSHAWAGRYQSLPVRLRFGGMAILVCAVLALAILDRAGLVTGLPSPWSRAKRWATVSYLAPSTGAESDFAQPRRASSARNAIAALLLCCALVVVAEPIAWPS